MNLRTAIPFLLLVAVSCPVRGGGAESNWTLLRGNDQAVWLVRTGEDGGSFDVFARKIGRDWEPVVTQLTGKPVAGVAVGKQLHLIYSGGQHSIVGLDGTYIVARNAPGEILALCEAVDFGETKGPVLLAMLLRNTRPKIQRPSSAPATSTTTALPETASKKPSAPHEAYHCLYRGAGGQWRALSFQPVPRADRKSLFLAVAKGNLYQFTFNAAQKEIPPSASTWEMREYMAPSTWVPVTGQKPTLSKPLAVLTVSDRVFIVTSAPASEGNARQLHVLHYDPGRGEFSKPQPIRRNGETMTWSGDALPQISRLGDQLALMWVDGGELRFALCGPAAVIQSTENLSKILHAIPDKERLFKLLDYFRWGVIIVVVLTMVLLRPRTAPKPFVLPKGMRPGNLLKRAVAAFLDYLPFSALASSLFMPPMNWDELKHLLSNPGVVPPEGLLYATILSLGLYVLYGIVMELRFGATLGKMLFRLRVVGDEGVRPKLREVALRNLLKIIELPLLDPAAFWFFGIFLLIPIITRYHQRLGDMVARTAVVDSAAIPLESDESHSPEEKKKPLT
ncbi:MAG TPA: RDD family protein [Phycisphaerae bacterium]|nr:RDD family protein [Phycisphaerae bacterium]